MKSQRIDQADQSLNTPYRILVANSQSVVLMGLKTLIRGLDGSILVEDASGGGEVIERLKASGVHLLILDFNMRGGESFGFVRHLRQIFPDVCILIYAANNELVFAPRFLRCGAAGYLMKRSGEQEVVRAIDTIRKGNIYMSDALSRHVSRRRLPGGLISPFEGLSEREFEVMLQLVRGNSAGEIATALYLNRSTVGTHKCRIMKKLGVKSIIELQTLARENDIV